MSLNLDADEARTLLHILAYVAGKGELWLTSTEQTAMGRVIEMLVEATVANLECEQTTGATGD